MEPHPKRPPHHTVRANPAAARLPARTRFHTFPERLGNGTAATLAPVLVGVLECAMQIDREGAAPEEPADPRRPLVLAGVAGFTIGATVIGLLWGLSGSADGAAEDARAACAALSRAGPLPSTYTAEAALGAGVVRHIVAARELGDRGVRRELGLPGSRRPPGRRQPDGDQPELRRPCRPGAPEAGGAALRPRLRWTSASAARFSAPRCPFRSS
jgi:hypothetical protein